MEEQYKDISKLVNEVGVESPTSDFLRNVMSRVEVISAKKTIIYKPLISVKGWISIGLVVIVTVLLLSFESTEGSILGKLGFLEFDLSFSRNPFSGYTFHKTTIYGILFLCFLFFVQVPMLKRRINRDFL